MDHQAEQKLSDRQYQYFHSNQHVYHDINLQQDTHLYKGKDIKKVGTPQSVFVWAGNKINMCIRRSANSICSKTNGRLTPFCIVFLRFRNWKGWTLYVSLCGLEYRVRWGNWRFLCYGFWGGIKIRSCVASVAVFDCRNSWFFLTNSIRDLLSQCLFILIFL